MPTESAIYAWVIFGSLGMIYWGYGKMKDWWINDRRLDVGL